MRITCAIGQADLDLGPAADTGQTAPVTHVSWLRPGRSARRRAAASHAGRMGIHRARRCDAHGCLHRPGLSPQAARMVRANRHRAFRPRLRRRSPNVYGVRGLHGLVWEWVHDFNSTMVVGDSRGDGSLERKLFCGAGSLLASDVTNYAAFMRYAFRSSLKGNYCVGSLGFRVAQSTSPDSIPQTLAATPVASPYDLAGRWQTQRGQEITLPSLRRESARPHHGLHLLPVRLPTHRRRHPAHRVSPGTRCGQGRFCFCLHRPEARHTGEAVRLRQPSESLTRTVGRCSAARRKECGTSPWRWDSNTSRLGRTLALQPHRRRECRWQDHPPRGRPGRGSRAHRFRHPNRADLALRGIDR